MISIPKYSQLLKPLFNKYGIKTHLRAAHFFAQVDHESNGLRQLKENLNYSVEGLYTTFSRSRISMNDCYKYGRTDSRKANQEKIANLIYGGEFGLINLGNKRYGDGWRYIGRGPLQCTGYVNYKKFSEVMGIDFTSNPELLEKIEYGLEFACWFWKSKGCNELADFNNIKGITKKINGGNKGILDRIELFEKYNKLNFEIYDLWTPDSNTRKKE